MIRRLVISAFLLLCFVAVAALWGKQHVVKYGERPIALASELVYQLPAGASFRRVAAELNALGVIDDPLQFRLYARLKDLAPRIKSGEYRIIPAMSHHQLIRHFVDGKIVQRHITLVEGLRVRDYLKQLQQNTEIQQTLESHDPEAVASLLGIEGGNPEGWIYPNTYRYTRDTTDLQLLQRAHRVMQQVLAEEWAQRQPELPLKTPYEALILASIVEKETAVPEERAQIAGVFIRRLQKGMRLQTDPTVIYGLGEAFDGNLTRAHLKRSNPYNTYRIKGLTPTPIANPGRDAIHAVLHPAPGNSLYFVARGDGSHQFSATYAEHQKAVQHYQQRRRRADYRSVPEPDKQKTASTTTGSDS